MEVGPRIIFKIGDVNFTETVIFGWIISIIILIFAFMATRNMQRIPKGAQLLGELLVGFIYKMV
jgi:F-type H+-transporting ATPase subunit a